MDKSKSAKIVCRKPTPGKKPTRIDKWKYDVVREAILHALSERGDGVAFKDLPREVETYVNRAKLNKLGSVAWYTTCVKLELEVSGEIRRIPGSSPQRLLRC